MSQVVNIIVTCTKQKMLEPPDGLQLRNVTGRTVSDRARRWVAVLQKSREPQISAMDLYAGDHWSVARDLQALGTASREIRVWVISAGYGLVSIDQAMCPYSATFSNPHPDSVILADRDEPHSSQKAAWWNAVTAAPWKRRTVTSLSDLASSMPESPMIIAASKNYLDAVYDDLLAATHRLPRTGMVTVISAGTNRLGELSGNLVPADARLQHYVGGIRRSLNIRLTRHVLQQTKRGSISFGRVHGLLGSMLKEAPDLQKFDRTPMSDGEIKKFIANVMKNRVKISHTPLLREFRANGNACEQKRFRKLFQKVQETTHG